MPRFLLLAALVMAPAASWADSITIPKLVRPTPGGDYVLRSHMVTTNSVTDLQYDVFRIGADGRVGDAIPGTTLRPGRITTRAGVRSNVLVVIPGAEIKNEQLLAACMWAEPPKPNPSVSSFSAGFRYCKLFTAKP